MSHIFEVDRVWDRYSIFDIELPKLFLTALKNNYKELYEAHMMSYMELRELKDLFSNEYSHEANQAQFSEKLHAIKLLNFWVNV